MPNEASEASESVGRMSVSSLSRLMMRFIVCAEPKSREGELERQSQLSDRLPLAGEAAGEGSDLVLMSADVDLESVKLCQGGRGEDGEVVKGRSELDASANTRSRLDTASCGPRTVGACPERLEPRRRRDL